MYIKKLLVHGCQIKVLRSIECKSCDEECIGQLEEKLHKRIGYLQLTLNKLGWDTAPRRPTYSGLASGQTTPGGMHSLSAKIEYFVRDATKT